jgi:hypothetical protein
MRVTISHREEGTGVTGKWHNYFVDCIVEFSEEERAIIRARSLYDQIVISGFLAPPPPPLSRNAPFWLRSIAPATALMGLIIFIQALFTKVGSDLSILILLISGAFWLYGFLGHWRQQKSLEEQRVLVRHFLDRRRLSIYASSPAHAKQIEYDLREKLVELKALIAGSADISTPKTFQI